MDRLTVQIGFKHWIVWVFAIATPLFALVLIGATWSVATNDWSLDRKVASIGTGWVVGGALLIVPEARYLIRTWRGIPALQIDSRGILWGNNWDRDSGIEWDQIARIGRPIGAAEYPSSVLLVEPTSTFRPSGSLLALVGSWVTETVYGTPFAIDLRILGVGPQELIGLIRERYRGDIDLSGAS